MSVLVSLAEAKANLRVTVTTDDNDINLKLSIAEGLVLEFLGYETFEDLVIGTTGSPIGGSPAGSPLPYGSPVTDAQVDAALGGLQVETLKAAIQLTLSNLYDRRDAEPLNLAVQSVLRRWRQPLIG